METEKKARRRLRAFSAREKSQAVLSVWSSRRNTSAVMKELGVPWGMLHDWEKRALAGMVKALDPTWKPEEMSAQKLPPRVERLIAQTFKQEST